MKGDLKCCRVVAIFSNVLKGGFIFGVKGGKEIIGAHDSETGNWSVQALLSLEVEVGVCKLVLNQLI